MFLNSLYYKLKPIIPRRLQIEIRRQIVLRKRLKYAHVWPIDEKAALPPEGWTGWPEGKKFALVLTHDVETAEGLDKCLKLVELDKSLGFRSSFNFIADEYRLFPELRLYLEQQGFEVGVHGLRHNVNLFKSKTTFQESVKRINQYLKDWQSVGFRAPSMYHNLDWIGDLDIQYDSSTFDTDPFEPQPDGVGTIFPFWVPGNNGQRGYVELPYTLPQDHSLFVIMGEKNIDIWKKKLDWIAEHGGMALLITHPDYMNFSKKKRNVEKYPVEYYREFLGYIKEKYEGTCWNALPKEVTDFWRNRSSVKIVTPKRFRPSLRVCMLSYSFYENDGRVKRYAETLAKRGDNVDVIALKKEGQSNYDTFKRVNLFRIQKRIRDEKSVFSYLLKIIRFLLKSAIFLTRNHLKEPYDIIHVHNLPDFLVFSTIFPKILGAKIILDIHDILPELYVTKFHSVKDGQLFKVLTLIEKISCAFSDHVIVANHFWGKKLISRSVGVNNCSVILNYPDESIFFKRPRVRQNDKIIILYPGSLLMHQGVDISIRAFAIIKDQVPNTEFHIYGDGYFKNYLNELVEEMGLQGKVFIRDPLPIEKIAEIISNADLGVEPKRNDAFSAEALSTKIFEFMSLGIPVVIPDTKIDKYYFNNSVVKFFESENVKALADSMLEMIQNPILRENIARNALKFVEDFSWEKRKHEYLDLVDRLVNS